VPASGASATYRRERVARDCARRSGANMARLSWALAAVVIAASLRYGEMSGVGTSSYSSPGGGSFSSSSSSSSSSSGGGSVSTINQSQVGGMVTLQCFHPASAGQVTWYRQARSGGSRQEIARNSQLSISEPRYKLSTGGTHVLTIDPTRESDSGMFECQSSAGASKFQLTIGHGNGASAGRASAAAAAGFMGMVMLM